MRKFMSGNGRLARIDDQSHFGSPGPATGQGTRPPGLATGLGVQSPGPAIRVFCHHRGDYDLGLVTYMTGRVEGCSVTASSHSVRGHPSTSDVLSTPAPYGPGIYYDPAEYGATDYCNPSYDAGLGRDFGTSGDGDRTRSEEPVIVGSLRIQSGEDDEDELEDNGGHDDNDGDSHDDDDGHGDDDELVPVAHASLSDCRLAPRKGKGSTGSFMSVMSKIAG
ncbi:hypothetical protein M9H77_22417 [Catharanthus roseus]|uniref:Uncharacterized protein n=1 Tax=Catharanthus roseus TaxID=4058 RepID=A0ACC0ARD0_CATRO|nr:hypothetical protein M9H77_22417 [Catharanthus roseus]